VTPNEPGDPAVDRGPVAAEFVDDLPHGLLAD
jgi:hypothetical protein